MDHYVDILDSEFVLDDKTKLLLHCNEDSFAYDIETNSMNYLKNNMPDTYMLNPDIQRFGSGCIEIRQNPITGNILEYENINDFGIGINDFTIEMYFYIKDGNTVQGLFDIGNETETTKYKVKLKDGTVLYAKDIIICSLYLENGYLVYEDNVHENAITRKFKHDTILANDMWHHLAFVRNDDYIFIYLDRVRVFSLDKYRNIDFNVNNDTLNFARTNYNLYYKKYYAIGLCFDEIRVSNVARYSERVITNNTFVPYDYTLDYHAFILNKNNKRYTTNLYNDTFRTYVFNELKIDTKSFLIKISMLTTNIKRHDLISVIYDNRDLFLIYIDDNNHLVFEDEDTKLVHNDNFDTNTWYDIILVKYDDSLSVYINKDQVITTTGYRNKFRKLIKETIYLLLGKDYNSSLFIDNIKISDLSSEGATYIVEV